MFHSSAAESAHKDIGDFGYPSVASFGPADSQKVIVFNDVDPLGSASGAVDVDLFTLRLFSRNGAKPQRFSP